MDVRKTSESLTPSVLEVFNHLIIVIQVVFRDFADPDVVLGKQISAIVFWKIFQVLHKCFCYGILMCFH